MPRKKIAKVPGAPTRRAGPKPPPAQKAPPLQTAEALPEPMPEPVPLAPSSETYWPTPAPVTVPHGFEVPPIDGAPHTATEHAALLAQQRAEDRERTQREAEDRRRKEAPPGATLVDQLGSIAAAHGQEAKETVQLLHGMEALALLADLDRLWMPGQMTFEEIERQGLYDEPTLGIWRHARRLLVASGRTPA